MNPEKIINQIEIIDSRIVELLNQRMEKIVIAKKFSEENGLAAGCGEVSDSVFHRAHSLLDDDFLKCIYEKIAGQSSAIGSRDLKIMAFQGEHGAYSEMASKTWNDKFVPIPCGEFSDVFSGVENGLYDYGIVPVENTLGGIVSEVNDLMIHTKLYVVGAVEIPISHCLLVYPGTDHREIREVYSHPQALAQCRRFIERNKLRPVNYFDTAGAAKMVAEKNKENVAAISSKLAAEIYNLEIIKESIEDYEVNRTRFLVLSRHENEGNGDKCSIVFSTAHKAGTLFNVLEKFASESINLTRIESIPSQMGNYAFFLDFMGASDDEKIKRVLEEVKRIVDDFRMIGCYEERKVK